MLPCASWHVGPPKANLLDGFKVSIARRLCIPDVMNDILSVTKRMIDECPCTEDNAAAWFTHSIDECPSAINAHAPKNPDRTSVGYLLIIQASSHELDEMNTSVMRVFHVAESLQQKLQQSTRHCI